MVYWQNSVIHACIWDVSVTFAKRKNRAEGPKRSVFYFQKLSENLACTEPRYPAQKTI